MTNLTIGPWSVVRKRGRTRVLSAHGFTIATVHALLHQKPNALLIAAAGTAAHEVARMGYDPIKAVEALPEIIAWINRVLPLDDAGMDYLNGADREDGDGWTDLECILARIKDTENE